MTNTMTKRAAARSAARQKAKRDPIPTQAPPSPSGVLKTSPGGKQYRLYEIPLADLPGFLDREGLEPRAFFHYPPESDWVLGVRRRDDPESREI